MGMASDRGNGMASDRGNGASHAGSTAVSRVPARVAEAARISQASGYGIPRVRTVLGTPTVPPSLTQKPVFRSPLPDYAANTKKMVLGG